MIDSDKLSAHLYKELISVSREIQKVTLGSLLHQTLAREMEVLSVLIEQVRGGKFAYEYEELEDALEDFDSFINNSM